MAKGITQDDVNGACDAIVAAGERPTVERIRLHLGTGSPNTIAPLLGRWWDALGDRLFGQRVALDLPDAPDTVRALAGELWSQAVFAAKAQVEAETEKVRDALAGEQAALAGERARISAELEALRTTAAEAETHRQQAQGRLSEALRLADQQAIQIDDLRRQHVIQESRLVESARTVDALRAKLEAQNQAAVGERESMRAHVQTTEDRAHAEVDRAREEAKRLQRELEALERERRREREAFQSQLTVAHDAQRHADAAAAGSERELRTVHAHNKQLHAQLAQALTMASAPRKASRPRPAKSSRPPDQRANSSKPEASSK